MSSDDPSVGSDGANRITLSTGETVRLPLTTEVTARGVVFPVPRAAVAELLPDALRPIRATLDGRAAVTLLSVEYHRIGDGQIAPYDEFAVVLPAVRAGESTLPYHSVVTRGTSGFMWYLPVTTEPAMALGVDVWGFPKVVADIDHVDRGSCRRTVVDVDGERFVTLRVDAPPSVRMTDEGYTYTLDDGTLQRVPQTVDARIGAWPLSGTVSVEFGEHPRAVPLRELDLGGRALVRISIEGAVRFYSGSPVTLP